jgi:opacity protein-like surface antigen
MIFYKMFYYFCNMKLKKIYFSFFFLIFNVINLNAMTTPASFLSLPSLPSSLYVGVLFGGKYSLYTHNYTGLSSLSSSQSKKNTKGPCLGFNLGYKYSFLASKTLLGLEGVLMKDFFKTSSDLKNDAAQKEGKCGVNNQYMMAILIVGGIHINPKMIAYVRTGYGINKIKVLLGGFQDGEKKNQFNKNLKSICLGGGISYFLSNKLEIGVDYMYHAINSTMVRNKNDLINGRKRELNLKIPYYYAGIRLIYNF